MLIDSHCHLDASEFDADRDHVVSRALAQGVGAIIVPAVARYNFPLVAELAAQHPSVHYALGIHPLYIAKATSDDLVHLEHAVDRAMGDPKFVGIGEIGLDFFVPALCTEAMRRKQIEFYSAQLAIAASRSLPVIVHVRRSVDLITKFIRRHPDLTGIAHAFNGSWQQAQILVERGFKLGFGGAMTYTRAKQIRRLAADLPADSIVLETDAPDIPPAWIGPQATPPTSSSRNEPKELLAITQCLAELRGQTLETVITQTTLNVQSVLPRLQLMN